MVDRTTRPSAPQIGRQSKLGGLHLKPQVNRRGRACLLCSLVASPLKVRCPTLVGGYGFGGYSPVSTQAAQSLPSTPYHGIVKPKLHTTRIATKSYPTTPKYLHMKTGASPLHSRDNGHDSCTAPDQDYIVAVHYGFWLESI